jgi:hypothetical protein
MFNMRNAHRILSVAGLLLAMGIAGCNKVTPDNFAKIKPGQSEAEVDDVLGKATTTETQSSAIATGSKKTWKSGDKTIMVLFIDGKVMDAEKTGF